MEPVDNVLTQEEKTILAEQRKRSSKDTQDLIKIIERLAGALTVERNRIGNRVFRNVVGK